MNAAQAIDKLKPEQWVATSINDRIRLLKEVRHNLKTYGDDLAKVDAKMKNNLMGEEIFITAT